GAGDAGRYVASHSEILKCPKLKEFSSLSDLTDVYNAAHVPKTLCFLTSSVVLENIMSNSTDMNAGGFCFRLFATCLVLSPTLGIASAITGNPGLGSMALGALAIGGVSLIVGIIIRIWE